MSCRLILIFKRCFVLSRISFSSIFPAQPRSRWPDRCLWSCSLSGTNYMVWKRLRAHFSLDNGLELLWSEVISDWNSLIRGSFERTLVWSEELFERTLVWSEEVFERTLVWSEDRINIFWTAMLEFRAAIIKGKNNLKVYEIEDLTALPELMCT